MKKILLILVWCLSIIGSSTLAATPISPVVKVRTYDTIQGKYPLALWEGSASIISKGWLLVTNNHVAQNADEENALWYIICFTMEQWKIPECNYTAHVIMRNTDLDIALLQLDNKDINGNGVDFASLPVLEIDYTYVPKDSEKVQAIGYPGIWWDTLTTTNGTVAGTLKYNWFTYIKTDATIAPGNSGWPMISAGGKQIWLNTFGISSDAESLWYGLLMSEAKSFIDKYKTATPDIIATSVNLGVYAKSIDQINKQWKVQLPWVTYTIPAWYEIKNTIDEVAFTQEPKEQKDVQASMLRIWVRSTPTITNEKTFLYYLESIGVYSKKYIKLVPTTISGKKFYKLVSSWDDTGWEWGGLQIYVWQLHKNAIVFILMYIDGESEKKLTEVKAEKELLLKNITFTDTVFNPSFDGKVIDPKIIFTKPGEWVWDAWGSDDTIIDLTTFVQNLHDGMRVSVSKTTKATNIQKLYNSELKDTAKNMKAIGKLQWNDAFITCSENSAGWYGRPDVDENNKPIQQFSCMISSIIQSVHNIPYRIDISIVWPRTTKEEFMNTMLAKIGKEIIIGSGKTTLPNLFKKNTIVVFKDLRDQTSAYRTKIDTLVWYNILKKWELFWPYNPITYWLLAEKYLQMVHNITISSPTCKTSVCLLQTKTITVNGKNTSLYDLFSDVKINWNGYVDEGKTADFMFYMKLKLAWVTLPVYSEEVLNEIQTDPENPDYTNIYAAIDTYNANLYGSKKIWYQEVLWDSYDTYYKSFFRATKIITYVPKKWVVTTPYFSDKPIIFDDKKIEKVNCSYVSTVMQCAPWGSSNADWIFVILHKWAMIDMLIDEMDFGLFDPEIAKKKEADIDDTNALDTPQK
jgi:Trypsin-like peptidase domain